MNYYNEWDKLAAQWLRELIKHKLIPPGIVDDRSITEVTASDLAGFTQCHFFAGIGGWPLALKLAGVSEREQLWTGSPPCQPFSVAGKQLGQYDERHLAPTFMRLVAQCRPPVLFGEQVAAAIAKSWMCDLQNALEAEDYAVGFAVLPACGVGAPHKRDRLFFGAHKLADATSARYMQCESASAETGRESGSEHPGELQARLGGHTVPSIPGSTELGGVADANHTGLEGRGRVPECTNQQPTWEGGVGRRSDSHNSFWSDADWIGCKDGKFRPVESGTFPLANGVPARVGRLRGYGNAIVPQVAAEFIQAFMESTQ